MENRRYRWLLMVMDWLTTDLKPMLCGVILTQMQTHEDMNEAGFIAFRKVGNGGGVRGLGG